MGLTIIKHDMERHVKVPIIHWTIQIRIEWTGSKKYGTRMTRKIFPTLVAQVLDILSSGFRQSKKDVV